MHYQLFIPLEKGNAIQLDFDVPKILVQDATIEIDTMHFFGEMLVDNLIISVTAEEMKGEEIPKEIAEYCDKVKNFVPEIFPWSAPFKRLDFLRMDLDGFPDDETIDKHADKLYTVYCEAVGGVAFNGDPLPDWNEFSSDENKTKQANGWRKVAAVSIGIA